MPTTINPVVHFRDPEKALGFLIRKGFDLELAHDALRRHAAAAVER
jgi:regulatory protein